MCAVEEGDRGTDKDLKGRRRTGSLVWVNKNIIKKRQTNLKNPI